MEMEDITVVKLGGSILDSRDTTALDLVALQRQGKRLVVVHGGASKVNRWLADQGVVSRFHQGERVTDRKALDVVVAVLCGLANKETVAAVIQAGGRAAGLSGVDGGLIQGRVKEEALGYVGVVERVDARPVLALLEAGYIPVVSPVGLNCGANQAGEPPFLNINGDTVAGELAAALSAANLIFLTDVDGVHDESGKVVSEIDTAAARRLLDAGIASGGMIPKIKAAMTAVAAGVCCNIVDGRRAYALMEALTGSHPGTCLKAEA
jgi:acetylglutamate kinase